MGSFCSLSSASTPSDQPSHISPQGLARGTEPGWDGLAVQIIAGHTRLLLLLAGDIESNPGPQSNEYLINGLAELIGEAPSSMREVLCVWCPDKPSNDAVNELNSRKFTVPVLQPALNWLINKDVTDPVVRSMRKGELAQAIVLGIERLLPDNCRECSKVYTVVGPKFLALSVKVVDRVFTRNALRSC